MQGVQYMLLVQCRIGMEVLWVDKQPAPNNARLTAAMAQRRALDLTAIWTAGMPRFVTIVYSKQLRL